MKESLMSSEEDNRNCLITLLLRNPIRNNSLIPDIE